MARRGWVKTHGKAAKVGFNPLKALSREDLISFGLLAILASIFNQRRLVATGARFEIEARDRG